MSTPSEKHSVKDVLDMVAKGIEDWRTLGDCQGEAKLWDHLASWAQSCARYARSLDEFKDMLREKHEKLYEGVDNHTVDTSIGTE